MRARGRASLFCLWWWNPLVAGTREVERLEEEGEAVSTEPKLFNQTADLYGSTAFKSVILTRVEATVAGIQTH